MPISVQCHKCSKQYRLKDELNGKKFKCQACGAIVLATPIKNASAEPAGRKTSTPKKKPADKSAAASPGKAASARPARKASAPPAAAKKKRPAKKRTKPDPYDDEYRDAYADDMYGALDDYGDDGYDDYEFVDDEYDDYAAAPPPRSKSKAKKKPAKSKKAKSKSKSSGGGFAIGFNINRLNIALVIIGFALFMLGFNEARLASKAGAEPTTISLADLLAGKNNGNIYLTVTGVEASDEYVYEERAGGRFSKVWIPCHPPGVNSHAFILYSTKANDEMAANSLMMQGSHTGMVTNSIRRLGSDEKELLQSIPGVNAETALIFEVGRAPSGTVMVILYFLGGALLILGGLAWIFLTGRG